MTSRRPFLVNRPLLARLEREWQALNHRPAVLRRALGWGLGVTFDSLDQVVAAAGYRAGGPAGTARVPEHPAHTDTHPGVSPGVDANEVLRRLLLAARTDDVAARVVLQRLLPGVIARARRWGVHRVGGSADAFDEMLSAIWMVIREYPVERRPQCLAAALLRDGEYRAFERASRRLLVLELTEPHLFEQSAQAAATVDAGDELAEVVAAARSLTEHDLRLIELFAQGRSSAEVASALSISERTVRYHRDLVVHRLRAAALAA